MKKPTANLGDLMLAAGVLDAPAWFSDIKMPNWPFKHQLEDLRCLVNNTRFGLFGEPGVGKSFPAQTHAILMAALGNKVVFTMPPKLIRQFQGEFKEFFQGIDKKMHIAHLDVGAVQKSKLIARWSKEGWPDILLISYDSFRKFNDRAEMKVVSRNEWKLPPEYWEDGVPSNYFTRNSEGEQVQAVANTMPFTKHGDPIKARRGKFKARNREKMRLKEEGYNVYFFDEAHALCNPKAVVWKGVEAMDMELKDDVALYLMTGTPVPTHLHNVYGIIRLLNSKAYFSKTQFERKHCIIDNEFGYKQYLGYKDEETIYHHLYKYARRVQKRDVLDLPESLISVTPITLTGKHKKIYDQVLNDRFAILGDRVLAPDNDSALRMLALQLISCPDEFDESGAVGKDNELAKWMDQVVDSVNPANHKLIIFAYFKSTIRFLAKRYEKWNPAVMNGATSKGWDEVERFKKDDTCRVFIVNWGSGGAGLNLQVSHHSAFYEVPTSPKDAKQAMARTDRSGQVKSCNFYFPRVTGTLLDKNFKNLLKNERSNNKVVGDKHDLLYDQLKVTKRKCA